MGFSDIFDKDKGIYTYGKRTICEVHRELYDQIILGLHNTNIPLIKKLVPLLEEALIMGIKMNNKLIEHKCGNDEWSEENLNKEAIKKLREERINLIKILETNEKILKGYNENTN